MVNTYTRMCDICKRPIADHDVKELTLCASVKQISYWRKDE